MAAVMPAVAQVCPTPIAVDGTACTVPPGSTVTASTGTSIRALSATNPGGAIVVDGVTVNLGAGAVAAPGLIGAIASNGAVISLGLSGATPTTITTVSTGAGDGQRGLVASGPGATLLANGSLLTIGRVAAASNNIGVLAEGGGTASLSGVSVQMRGAATGIANYGLMSTGTGSLISFSGGSVNTLSASSYAAFAQSGGQILFYGPSVLTTSGRETPANTGPASHVLFATGLGSAIAGSGVSASTTGASTSRFANAARAEQGATITLSDSTLATVGVGSAAAPAAAAYAMSGGTIDLTRTALTASGQLGYGLGVTDAGSKGILRDSTIDVGGRTGHGVYVNLGGEATIERTAINVTGVAVGVQAENGSRVTMTDSTVTNSAAVGYGVRSLSNSTVTMTGGSVTTTDRDAAALSVGGGATLTATNVRIVTTGADNSMGAIVTGSGRLELIGGSVTTTGSPVRDPNNTHAHGLAARSPGALLIASGTAGSPLPVITRGSDAYGAVTDDGGQMRLNFVNIRTEGERSIGLYSGVDLGLPGNVDLLANDSRVETFGTNAYGAHAGANFLPFTAVIAINDSAILTHGDGAVGLRAVSGGTIIATRSTVDTEGLGAHGMLARSDPSSVTVNQSTIRATGALAHGAVAQDGGRIAGVDSTVSTTAAGMSALFATAGVGATSIADFAGSTLTNRSGPTIGVAGAANIVLANSTVGGSGQWLSVGTTGYIPAPTVTFPLNGVPELAPDDLTAAPAPTPNASPLVLPAPVAGLANIIASASVLNGTAFTAPGSVSNVSLLNGTVWNMSGDSNLTTLLNDASTINFAPPSGGNFRTLTVGNYTGAGGTLAMNTFLGADNSPSDRLVINGAVFNGGTASGTSSMLIANAGGAGALTTGNGILVVDGINGGTTQPGAFALGRPVVAGPYEYTLFRSSRDGSNAQAWYLRSTLPPQPPEPPPSPPDPNPGPSPQPRPTPTPNYRQEISLYAAVPSMVQSLGLAMLDNLHDRVGEEEHLRGRSDIGSRPYANGAWVRIFAQHIGRDGGGIFRDGPAYQQDMAGFQAGFDLLRRETGSGHRDHAGVYVGAAAAAGSVDHVITGTRAGRVQINGYSLGGYWTHFGPGGWYLDAIAQISTYDVKATSTRLGLSHSGDTTGYAASLEGGYPLAIREGRLQRASPGAPGWVLEPQAQLTWQRIVGASGGDAAASLRYDDTDSLVGRLSLRLVRTWLRRDSEPSDVRRTTAWVRAGVFHEFLGESRMYVSSAAGAVPFRSDLGGTWAGFNIGVSSQVGTNTSLYANANYQTDFSGDRHSYGGRAGIRVNW